MIATIIMLTTFVIGPVFLIMFGSDGDAAATRLALFGAPLQVLLFVVIGVIGEKLDQKLRGR